jgi:hypothetical protein
MPADPSLPPSFAQQLQPNYLGSPTVVNAILKGFIGEIQGWVLARRAGTMTTQEMAAKIHERGADFSTIFCGENPKYQSVAGWNSREWGISSYMKVDLGHYYLDQYDAWKGDALGVTYNWLAWLVVQAMKHDDPDEGARMMGDNIRTLVQMLTGTIKRRGM